MNDHRHACGNTAVDSPLAYLFSAIPWSLTKSGLAACIANSVGATGLCVIGMWLSGKWKWVLMAVCSMPVTLTSIGWMGADAMVIGTAMIMLGCGLGSLDSRSWVSVHHNAVTAIMIVDAMMLGRLKSNLCLIALLPLALPLLLGRSRWP